MTYKMLLASTAILLLGTTAALADCASLYNSYSTSGSNVGDDVTLTTPDRSIECEFENGVLVKEEITLADGTEVEREYNSDGVLFEEKTERDDDAEDDRDEDDDGEDDDRGHGNDADGVDDDNPGNSRGGDDDEDDNRGNSGADDDDKDDEDDEDESDDDESDEDDDDKDDDSEDDESDDD